ncbi:MAG TPA: pyridoxal-phosphate dependent enzyme, partial [Candidatus Baltobacteraceae bacterium]|nr:pyridoxal-phosphate dependent enzyme [Candidatus Baltobacteraceae bacterium]
MDTRGAALKQSVTLADVRAAAARLKGIAHRTPVLTSRTLDGRTGGQIFLKCENFQRMGAFKFRGAYNRIVQLDDAGRRAGVVAFSSGNHAQGVALASALLGVPAVIVMPSDAPKSKVAATREYGAEVIFYDRHHSHRAQIAQRICDERGATLVPPFDDPEIIAGQGTVGLELVEELTGLEMIVTPVGGGGLLSGTAVAARAINSEIQLFGVEPQAGDDFARSLRAGERVHIEVPETIADGLQTQSPGELTFGLVQTLTQGIVTVSDAELRRAMAFAFERMK